MRWSRIIAVGGDLLERLDQFGGAVEIGHQLRGRIAAGLEEFVEAGAPEIAARDFGGEHRGLALQRRGHRQADADGIVDLVGDARHQPPERRELFRLDQRVLGLAQIAQRRFGGILGLAHLQFAALALADVERDGDDVLDLAVGIEQRQLVDQPLPHIAGGIHVFLFVEAEPAARRQHPLVVLVGLLRAVARHQVGGGAADRVRGLDAENAGHVAVHQDIAQLLVLDVDHRGHGVDHLLQQPAAFGDRILGALLIGDVAHRAFIADHLAALVAHGGGAVGKPEDRAVALAHLIFELAHHAVALHQRTGIRARAAGWT